MRLPGCCASACARETVTGQELKDERTLEVLSALPADLHQRARTLLMAA